MQKPKISWSHIVAYTLSAVFVILIVLKLVQYYSDKSSSNNIAHPLEQTELDIVFGNENAQLAVFMYSNYSCNFCRQFFTEVYPQLQDEFINNSKVKLIMRLAVKTNNIDLLNSLKTAVCIAKHGNFSYLHQLLLADHMVVFSNEFRSMIDEFIDSDEIVAECILGGEAEAYLLQNLTDFNSYGFKGTPTFVIGKKVYSGYREYPDFKAIIEKHLNSK